MQTWIRVCPNRWDLIVDNSVAATITTREKPLTRDEPEIPNFKTKTVYECVRVDGSEFSTSQKFLAIRWSEGDQTPVPKRPRAKTKQQKRDERSAYFRARRGLLDKARDPFSGPTPGGDADDGSHGDVEHPAV